MEFSNEFRNRYKALALGYEHLLSRPNRPILPDNGIYTRYEYPVLTAEHTPIYWRYDLDEQRNPYLMQRQGIGATFNAGAMLWEGKYLMVVRTEGWDRKSFFSIAESPNGIDQFRFWPLPLEIPETDNPDTNVYDMRLVHHEDGWIYGLFCTERKDPSASPGDESSAVAQCGIVRTKDLKSWERLPDLKTKASQQRNVVLHPEFINGKYAFYTRPQDGFISVGGGGGIGWGLSETMENAQVDAEEIIDGRVYHTVMEVKNGQGPAPIKTEKGWLHIAHGVRGCAAGLRYVLYMFMTDLQEPWRVTHRPAGHFIAPLGEERVGDVSNVVFTNGWIVNAQQEVFVYYASCDTRMHVATSTVDRLVDYVLHTPEDGYRSATSVATRSELIKRNLEILPHLA
ncbi:MAG: glycosidase [Bacteroidota bacterium]